MLPEVKKDIFISFVSDQCQKVFIFANFMRPDPEEPNHQINADPDS